MRPLKRFVPLDGKRHDRASFDCGKAPINRFLRQSAGQGMRARVSYTWVLPAAGAEPDEQQSICAFYTLSIRHIEREELPADQARRYPRYPLPVFLIAQLGVDRRCQGQGLGSVALINALRRCARLSRNGKVPAIAVVLDALDDDALAFYRRFEGFDVLTPARGSAPARLYIPMKTVELL